MARIEEEKAVAVATDRIRWDTADQQEEGRGRPAGASGAEGAGARSVGSKHSRRRSIDPAAELPIQYRTMSIDLDDYKRGKEAAKSTKNAVGGAEDLADLDWHVVPVNELVKRLETSEEQGLSSDEVRRRQSKYGKNQPPPPKTHYASKIFGYCFKGFGSILLVASILVFVSWQPLGDPDPSEANLALAIVLLAVFFIQAGFNAYQDWSSSRVLASIKTMLPGDTFAIRNGNQAVLPSSEIVPGDVLLIKAGNKLPADVRFVNVSSDAKFDRSILTGESLPQAATIDSTDPNYLETKCIGLQGTYCVSGSCRAIVVSTGSETVFGRIAKLTNKPKAGLSTLEREILNFVLVICSFILVMIIVVIIIWATYLRTYHPEWINVPTLIVDCVSVATAFIPEGLPIALTASMTISANLMRKNKVLCKSLKTVETLGAVSVLCSDKTGTLTENKMVVTECAVGTQVMSADAARESRSANEKVTDGNSLAQLHVLAGLCNAGEFDAETLSLPLAERRIHGDATDQAILRFAESLGSVAELRRSWNTQYDLAFNSKNKFMIRLIGTAQASAVADAMPKETAAVFQAGDSLLTMKGAPDVLIDRCTRYIGNSGASLELDAAARERIEEIKNDWSSQGRRVLLLAHKAVSRNSFTMSPSADAAFEKEVMEQARTGLTLVGLVGIVDPPRKEIPEVVRTLRGAQIRIFMVTGDFALTAQAIARECGIITNPPAAVHDVRALARSSSGKTPVRHKFSRADEGAVWSAENPTSIVLSGNDLLTLNDDQWTQLVQEYNEVVFARTTPEQKLRIVRELQQRAQVVGMTGDGVNDAPALRAADIGIAIGGGSDIAIEAADMVLLESFAGVVEAVRLGRMMFDNLRKTVGYLLPAGSFSEFWPVFTNVAFGLPQVLSSFLMIIICCFTDCMAATTLAYEKPEADVLSRPPRRIGVDRLVDTRLILQAYGFIGVLETVSSFSMSYWYLQRNGVNFGDLWFSFGNYTPDGMSADYFANLLNTASSIYFVNLVVMQWFNLLGVRTRRLSIFNHPPILNKSTQNYYLFPAMVFAALVAVFWCYPPVFHNVLQTANVPAANWFLPMALGLGVLCLEEIRKMLVRRYPRGFVAYMAW